MCEFRIKKAVVQSRFIRKEKQTFRVHIQSSERIYTSGKSEICQRPLARTVRCELAENTVWFIESENHLEKFSVDAGCRSTDPEFYVSFSCVSHLKVKIGAKMIHFLQQSQYLPIPIKEAWKFFSTPANLDEITPDEIGFKTVYQPGDSMYEGQIIEYRIMVAPAIWVPWVTEIKSVEEGRSFVDEQRFGPYKFWHHRHTFEERDGGTLMKDLVHYALPMWPFGEIAHGGFVRPKLERIFAHRQKVLEERFGRK